MQRREKYIVLLASAKELKWPSNTVILQIFGALKFRWHAIADHLV